MRRSWYRQCPFNVAVIAILLGIELDSEIERERQPSVDEPGAADRIQLPLRQK